MTEYLITRVSFTPKASKASDFDMVTITRLSQLLKEIISNSCGSGEGICYRSECKEEQKRFTQSIDEFVQASSVLPENFVAHVRSQAEK
jgi:hypothetical protein